jgi:hypothetical protein
VRTATLQATTTLYGTYHLSVWAYGPTLPEGATEIVEDGVPLGGRREYEIHCSFDQGRVQFNQRMLVGIDAPDRDDPGVVLVLVDADKASSLASELDRLTRDLEAEGWGVARELVPPAESVVATRARVKAQHAIFKERLRAALLLGAIPRLLSGHIMPDGHPGQRSTPDLTTSPVWAESRST